jgi:hypothetical protein
MIDWISVSDRVPDNRRKVLVWGHVWLLGIYQPSKTGFMGSSKCNVDKTGAHFDVEKGSCMLGRKVTHWAEITSPNDKENDHEH